MSELFNTPILMLVFNRPDTTRRVFDVVKSIKPKKLYIAADGPRAGTDDKEKNEQVKAIFDAVDWDCEVKKLYRHENMGCKKAVSSAIDWFFQQEPEGIILEDDCLPDLTFFTYCQKMLEHHRDDPHAFMICGTNEAGKFGDVPFYSKMGSVWGWAGWKSKWEYYDVEMRDWPEMRKSGLLNQLYSDKYDRFARDLIFNKTWNGDINTWDYQLTYMIWKNDGYAIIPPVNLISNIGFGSGATHTTQYNANVADRETFSYNNIPDKKIDLNYEAEYDQRIIPGQHNWKLIVKYWIKFALTFGQPC